MTTRRRTNGWKALLPWNADLTLAMEYMVHHGLGVASAKNVNWKSCLIFGPDPLPRFHTNPMRHPMSLIRSSINSSYRCMYVMHWTQTGSLTYLSWSTPCVKHPFKTHWAVLHRKWTGPLYSLALQTSSESRGKRRRNRQARWGADSAIQEVNAASASKRRLHGKPRSPSAASIKVEISLKNLIKTQLQVTSDPSLKACVTRPQRSVTFRLDERITVEHAEIHGQWAQVGMEVDRVIGIPTISTRCKYWEE
jgi:hypothetical protein